MSQKPAVQEAGSEGLRADAAAEPGGRGGADGGGSAREEHAAVCEGMGGMKRGVWRGDSLAAQRVQHVPV